MSSTTCFGNFSGMKVHNQCFNATYIWMVGLVSVSNNMKLSKKQAGFFFLLGSCRILNLLSAWLRFLVSAFCRILKFRLFLRTIILITQNNCLMVYLVDKSDGLSCHMKSSETKSVYSPVFIFGEHGVFLLDY